MALLNTRFYDGQDKYSDGDVEDEILNFVSDDSYQDKLSEFIGDSYAKAYHLSDLRENILNWYPFERGKTALEIGAGCGALSGFFCRKFSKVDSIELSMRRSKINYERHKDLDNLEIFVGDFNVIDTGRKYDYVFLIGVLEYAALYSDADDPYDAFLKKVKKYLNSDGKLIIAIENRLGLKYFNGSREDHSNIYFDGLNNYTSDGKARTFSRTELTKILDKVGLREKCFYYPYPDYKFPEEIHTDSSVNNGGYDKRIINIEEKKMPLFNEYSVGQTLANDGIRGFFANSFLVVSSNEKFESTVKYVKAHIDRNDSFKIATIVEGQIGEDPISERSDVVKKIPLSEDAKKHLSNMLALNEFSQNSKISYLHANSKEDYLEYEFIREETLSDRIKKMYSKKTNLENICLSVKVFFDEYFSTKELVNSSLYQSELFTKWFGEEKIAGEMLCANGGNVDLIADNIFIKDDKYILIDGEWVFPELIPCKFLVWRCLNEICFEQGIVSGTEKYYSMMSFFEIIVEEDKTFRKWAEYFANVYVGSDKVKRSISKEMYPVQLNEVYKLLTKKIQITSQLYIDYGNGFSEDNKIVCESELKDGRFDVTFLLDQIHGYKSLRFDVLEGDFCRCSIEYISEGYSIVKNNASKKEGKKEVFLHIDPWYKLKSKKEHEKLRIAGTLEKMDNAELIKYLK